MRQIFVLAAAALFLAATAGAQTKITGALQCGKPDVQHMVPVGDRPEHSLGVEQFKCTWTKPLEIGGDKSKDAVSTDTYDVSGNMTRSRGFHVTTMESGDKYSAWYQGTGTLKDGAAVELKGNWEFTDGSGKLKGIKGKGTYTCAPSGDALACSVEGEYRLAK